MQFCTTISRVVGLEDPNYTLAPTGHTDGQVNIVPRPVSYTTLGLEFEYGTTGTYYGEAAQNPDDIVQGDQV